MNRPNSFYIGTLKIKKWIMLASFDNKAKSVTHATAQIDNQSTAFMFVGSDEIVFF